MLLIIVLLLKKTKSQEIQDHCSPLQNHIEKIENLPQISQNLKTDLKNFFKNELKILTKKEIEKNPKKKKFGKILTKGKNLFNKTDQEEEEIFVTKPEIFIREKKNQRKITIFEKFVGIEEFLLDENKEESEYIIKEIEIIKKFDDFDNKNFIKYYTCLYSEEKVYFIKEIMENSFSSKFPNNNFREKIQNEVLRINFYKKIFEKFSKIEEINKIDRKYN